MTSVVWLPPDTTDFPPVSQALQDPNGLLAAGGDLSSARLLSAYRQGIFPWFDDDQPILWWSPDPRCVLYPEQLHVSRSLAKAMRRLDYEITFDTAFSEVITACSAPRSYETETWITDDMQAAYIELHKQGQAHSVELWVNGELTGGLYGIAMGALFFGESMFSRASNASKIAFAHFVEQLKNWGYYLIDCQVDSEHLTSLGASTIPRSEFIRILARESEEKLEHSWRFDEKVISNYRE